MKKIALAAFVLTWISSSAQHFDWAKRGGLWAYDYGNGIGTDNSGNIYVAGKFEQNANFSGVILPCQGNHDVFVAKYNPSGGLVWIRTAGGPSGDYAHAMATDSKFVYAAGEIEGTNTLIKFIGSPITLRCVGSNDVLVTKYDLNGNLIWARSAGGYNDEKALGVTYDNSGNIYVCGYYKGYSVFGGTTISGFGDEDIFIAKYDANGNFLWVRRAGSSGKDEPKNIKCDATGNVYMCGMYSNGCNFSGQILSSPNGYANAFLVKYSSSGTLLWAKTGGGNYDDVAWGVTIDNYGKIFVTGEFNASANFGGMTIYTSGSADVFVACYDNTGNVLWVKKAGGPQIDRARAIATDGSNLFITGQFGGTAYFGSTSRTAADGSDIFMACLNNSGQFLWANSAGGPADAYENLGFESGIAICAEPTGNVYATGAMLNGASFGSTYLSPFSRTDVFITKLRNGVPARENEEPPLANEELFFDGKIVEKMAALSWNYTAAEKKDIILEKSYDAINFKEVKSYYNWEQNKTNSPDYTYSDMASGPNSEVQYRLRLIDQGGATSFSRVVIINLGNNTETSMEIFPNPAQTGVAINIKNVGDKKLQLLVTDIEGREVWNEEIVNDLSKLDISAWSRGTYIVTLRNNEGVLSRRKVLLE